MRQLIHRFWEDESGPEMVEWAVVTLVLLIATVPALILLRDTMLEVFRQVFTALEEDPDDQWVP